MPVQSSPMQQPQSQETAKLVHATKQNSPDDPIQLAFSVIDDSGQEQIVQAVIPSGTDLYELCQQENWLQKGLQVTSRRFQRRSA